MKEISLITWLSEWYKDQCNGDWEHSYGVKISTLDNPGWELEIDIRETQHEGLTCAAVEAENTTDDWLRYEITDDKFLGYCSPNNLHALINIFKDMIDKAHSIPDTV